MGALGGTHNFSTQFASLAEGATPGVGDHTLTAAQLPVIQQSGSWLKSTATGSVLFSGGGQYGFASLPSFGGGSAHGHTVDLRVKWAACLVCTKD